MQDKNGKKCYNKYEKIKKGKTLMKKIKNLVILTIVTMTLLTLTACSLRRLVVNTPSIEVIEGETYQIEASVKNYDNAPVISFATSDSAVATVDQTGLVYAVKPGTVEISVTCGKMLQVIDVIVRETPYLTISGPEVVDADKEIVLDVETNATDLVWTSSDESVATVKDGVVKTISDGTVTIKAENYELSESIVITVKDGTVKYNVVLDLDGGAYGEVTTISAWADIFMADFNAAAGTEIAKETFQKNSGTAIKTAISNEEFYNKYQWLLEFAYNEMVAKNVGVTDAMCTDTIEFLEALKTDYDTAKAMVNNGAAPGPNGRTCFRNYLEGLLNETLSSANGAYKPYCVDYSLAENQAKFWKVYLDTELELTKYDTLPIAVKEGHIFLGWYANGKKVVNVTDDCTLTAQWELIKFNINYDLAGGAWGDIQAETTFGYNVFTKLVAPVKEGYVFDGWYEGENKVATIDENRDYNLTAQWREGYNVTFDLDGGLFEGDYTSIADFANAFISEYNAVTNTTITKEGFHVNSASSIKTFFAKEEMLNKYQWLIQLAHDMIDAKYQASPSSYDSTIYTNAMAMIDRMLEMDTTAINVSDGGYGRTMLRHFIHNLINEDYSIPSAAQSSYQKLSTDFSLEENKTIVLKALLSPTERTVMPNESLPVAVKEGYNFLGWYVDDVKVEKVTADCTLTAKWQSLTEVKYTISYDLAEGSWGEKEGVTEFTHGDTVELVEPVREGYIFMGWYEDETKVTTIGNDDYVLVARWQEKVNDDYEPTTLVVDPSNPDAYATLEVALAAAKQGDTIKLAAGTYTGVTIEVEGLILVGPNAGINPNTGTRASEAVFTTDIVVAADKVTLEGIKLTGAARIVGSPDKSISDLLISNVLVSETTAVGSTTAPLYFVPTAAGVSYKNTYISNMRIEQVKGRVMIMYGTMIDGITVMNSEFLGTSSTGEYNDGFKFNIVTDTNRVIDYEYDVKGNVTFIGNKINKYCQYPVWLATYGEGNYVLENNVFTGSAVYTNYNDACFCFTTFKSVDAGSKVKINVAYNTATASGILVRIQAAGLDSTTLEAKVNYNKIYSCVHTLFVSDNSKNSGNYIDATYNYYDKAPTTDNFSGVSAWEPYYASEDEVPTYGSSSNFYEINYKLNGGSLPESYPTGFDSVIGLTALPTPTRDGYTFEGWYVNGKLVTGIAKGTEEDITLEAKWKEIALYVGEGYYATIAEALAAAEEGNTIIILAGTYNENITISLANLTIKGPNAGINPNTETRVAEAILTGTINVTSTASNLTIDGLSFTGAARIEYNENVAYEGFTFQNNKVYDTTESTVAWSEGRYGVTAFIEFTLASGGTVKNVEIFNNSFVNVSETNVLINRAINLTVDGNVFKDFDYDAIRTEGGYVYGLLSFTNNTFEQTNAENGAHAIFFRSIAGPSGTNTVVDIINNKFIKLGKDTGTVFTAAISAYAYQENPTVFNIKNNIFDHCYDYLYLRNNGATAAIWSCTVEDNQFLGLPTNQYYGSYRGTDKESTNPHLAIFTKNYYEDNSGAVISDLTVYASYFKHMASYGTALATKPGETEVEPLEFYIIEYELDGGVAEGTFVTSYDSTLSETIAIPKPNKANHQFIGWNLNGELVQAIPATARGDLFLVAEYEVLEGEVYNITFVDSENLGTWPTRDAKSKDEIITLLLADIYEWAVSNGETNTYDDWYTNAMATMAKGSSINLRDPSVGAIATDDGSTEYFINVPKYYEKWVEFFKEFDKAMLGVNSEQCFFSTDLLTSSDYATYIRFSEFINGSRAKLDNYLTEMLKVVRVEAEVVNQYQGGQIVVLPVLTNKLGIEFLGWYDNAEFSGSPIVQINTTDTGDKTYYAKWAEKIEATAVEVNVIDKILRYETYQLVWSFVPANTTYQYVEFFSSDSTIASVGLTSGLITTYKNGEVTITMIVYGNRELDLEMKITVYSPDHLEGSYETESVVEVNGEIMLNAVNVYLPNETVTWSSKNTDIAVVEATTGKVTGVTKGLATIVATSKDASGNDITLDFVVVVIDSELSDVAKFIISQNEANVFTHYGLYVNGNAPFYEDIFGSVNKVLFEEFSIDTTYVAAGDASKRYYENSNANGPEFITVHYTANNSSSAGALTHAKYFTSSNVTTSIHYTTGNDGVYQALSHTHGAYHAGDSSSYDHTNYPGDFAWYPTGVQYTGTEAELENNLLNIEWTASNDFYFEINGQKTSIKLPDTWDYVTKDSNGNEVHRYGNHIYNADGTITSQSNFVGTAFANQPVENYFNDQGFPVTVINGEYYMGPTWWSYGQTTAGLICGSGGNRNSIGIESAVNAGSDLWLTWQKTAQLVAKLMVDYDLDISRVKGHHFFDGKDCPQPMLENDLEIWYEFLELVQAERDLLAKYSDYTFEVVSNNPEIIDNNGRVIAQPEFATTVTYTVTIKDANGQVVDTVTLASMVQGIYEK